MNRSVFLFTHTLEYIRTTDVPRSPCFQVQQTILIGKRIGFRCLAVRYPSLILFSLFRCDILKSRCEKCNLNSKTEPTGLNRSEMKFIKTDVILTSSVSSLTIVYN